MRKILESRSVFRFPFLLVIGGEICFCWEREWLRNFSFGPGSLFDGVNGQFLHFVDEGFVQDTAIEEIAAEIIGRWFDAGEEVDATGGISG